MKVLRHFRLPIVMALCLCLRADRLRPSADDQEDKSIQELISRASDHYKAGDLNQATALYRKGVDLSGSRFPRLRALNLIGLGNTEGIRGNYSRALRPFREALQIGEIQHSDDVLVKAGVGLISVYRSIPDLDAARQVLGRIEPVLIRSEEPVALAQAAAMVRDLDFDKSRYLYFRAITTSSMRGDLTLESSLWNQLGHAYLLKKQTVPAEAALTEALRLSAATPAGMLQPAMYYLGSVRRTQGRYPEAMNWLEAAYRSQGKAGTVPAYQIDYQIGLTLEGMAFRRDALLMFERALVELKQIRGRAVGSETFRVRAEAGVQDLVGSLVNAGMSEYERTGDTALAFRMLVAAETSRNRLFAATQPDQSLLSADYEKKLTEYRQALARSSKQQNENTPDLQRLRFEIANREAEADRANSENSPQNLEKEIQLETLRSVQNSLSPAEVLLSFHLSDHGSFVWAISRNGLEAHRLPRATELVSEMNRVRQQFEQSSPAGKIDTARLSSSLFGKVQHLLKTKQNLVFCLDGPLFRIPLAALDDGTGTPILQKHSVRQVPSSLVLSQAQNQRPGTSDLFVGFGDAIYNAADRRFKGRAVPEEEIQLNRLPNSAREITRCALAWNGNRDSELVTGSEVSRNRLDAELAKMPAVLHLGTHVLPNPAVPDQALIALGLRPSGSNEYLAPAEIAHLGKAIGLVTLSGCHSGSGRADRGLGLQGLSRAWLLAGARSVVATYWPIPDDDGELLANMYAELSRRGGDTGPREVASALRAAQQKMAGSSGWKSEPTYWGAFFVVGKE